MWNNGFYPISAAGAVVLAWRYSLNPLAGLLLIAVMYANVAVHELGHVAAVRLTGGRVTGLTIKPAYGMTRLQQPDRLAFAMIALAGPVAGLVCGGAALFVLDQLAGPAMAGAVWTSVRVMLLVGMCDNLVNLMPVGVMDGSQFVRAIREWRIQHRPTEPVRKPTPIPATEVRHLEAA